jgi:hypothetical protein
MRTIVIPMEPAKRNSAPALLIVYTKPGVRRFLKRCLSLDEVGKRRLAKGRDCGGDLIVRVGRLARTDETVATWFEMLTVLWFGRLS